MTAAFVKSPDVCLQIKNKHVIVTASLELYRVGIVFDKPTAFYTLEDTGI